ncbi:protein-tyrosine-phosphatase [Nocardia sp. ET3-3]|uniref:Protein-tyrosine-phosphatase n=1 Tax=Nocardia terrae TaxID=2675851 RepID=A0A7K1US60_9NOCA|nr:tyrosine-protein phosphatase [Nocardia terrae]MVU77167.1 protein-tyrosine-phosphatase [Nocardia terrae]
MNSRRLFLVLACTTVAAVTGCSGGTDARVGPPTRTSAVVVGVDERALPLPGVENARDVGGYRTVDGRQVRTGLVYRSGELSTASDPALAYLTGHDLKFDDDLRLRSEIAKAPDRVAAGAAYRNVDVVGQASPEVIASAQNAGPDLYRAFITTPGANEGFAAILHDIIDTTAGTVLYHCSSGKDRTGWTTAVLLTVLGVDRQTVYYDFLLSNYYRDAAPGDTANGVVATALDAAFDQADQSYGSFDNYVRNGLKLTDADVAALQAKMLS